MYLCISYDSKKTGIISFNIVNILILVKEIHRIFLEAKSVFC